MRVRIFRVLRIVRGVSREPRGRIWRFRKRRGCILSLRRHLQRCPRMGDIIRCTYVCKTSLLEAECLLGKVILIARLAECCWLWPPPLDSSLPSSVLFFLFIASLPVSVWFSKQNQQRSYTSQPQTNKFRINYSQIKPNTLASPCIASSELPNSSHSFTTLSLSLSLYLKQSWTLKLVFWFLPLTFLQ